MISTKYAAFFKGLEKNNNRDWFQENKKSYENDVKKPFLSLLDSLIPHLVEFDGQISGEPKDALFRINRDIRFAKDKTPYNILMKAGFAPGGKKSFLPGYYLGISYDTIHVGGGLFNLKSPELKLVRDRITEYPDDFVDVISNPDFVNKFGELKGERAKRLDVKYQSVLEKTDFILNKQFYAMAEIDLTGYFDSKKILDVITSYFKTINPLNQFLKEAFK